MMKVFYLIGIIYKTKKSLKARQPKITKIIFLMKYNKQI